jgi:5'-deoxynucleotidase YfbR-like HD superfamily hydrolase
MSDCWLQTFSGVQFFPLSPRVEDIRIEDIAHALSNQCRFSGHVKQFYSVAEHSVRIARVLRNQGCKNEVVLWGLLHDASEAYLVDLPRPLKRTRELGDAYQKIEQNLMKAVCQRFGLPIFQPHCVSEADHRILITEKRDLLGPAPAPWSEEQGVAIEPYVWKIYPWTPDQAEAAFLEAFGWYSHA